MTEDEKEKQRFWNLMVFKIYATDDEIKDILPLMGVLLIILFAVLYWIN